MSGVAGGLVGGRYRLVALVGQGGMGRVWRGADERLNREVAIKEVLLPDGVRPEDRGDLLARAMREGHVAARLNHPSIVTVHDVVEDGGTPWIVMEFIPGRSLGAAIAKDGRLTWDRAAEIGAQVADGLAHAHASGIVHRDLKPDNVLLHERRVIITDFGIARYLDDSVATRLTSTGQIIGTPHYMPPEQIEGGQAAPAGDVWSLGATLYAAVEGDAPFNAPTLMALFNAILSKPLPTPKHAGPLAPILRDVMAKDPARRPTADALAKRLVEIRSPHKVQGRPPLKEQERPLPSTTPTAPAKQITPVVPVLLPARVPKTRTAPAVAPAPTPPKPSSPLRPAAGNQPPQVGRREVVIGGLAGVGVGALGIGMWLLGDSSRPGRHSDAVLDSGQQAVTAVAFSPDGKTLASNVDYGAVRLWDVATRTSTDAFVHDSRVINCLAFSPDGKRVAVGSNYSICYIVDITSKAVSVVPLMGLDGSIRAAAFSPDGKSVVTAGDGGIVRVWNAENGSVLRDSVDHVMAIQSLALSPDGKTVATASMDEYTVRLWNAADGTALGTLTGHGAEVRSVAFSPDGKKVASASTDMTVRVWDAKPGSGSVVLSGHSASVAAVAFSRDGFTLASASDDQTVRVWNTSTFKQTAVLSDYAGGSDGAGSLGCVAISPDGATVVGGELIPASAAAKIRLWNLKRA